MYKSNERRFLCKNFGQFVSPWICLSLVATDHSKEKTEKTQITPDFTKETQNLQRNDFFETWLSSSKSLRYENDQVTVRSGATNNKILYNVVFDCEYTNVIRITNWERRKNGRDSEHW